jgi:hypothetical protein
MQIGKCAEEVVVSPLGIEPRTYRLRVPDPTSDDVHERPKQPEKPEVTSGEIRARPPKSDP